MTISRAGQRDQRSDQHRLVRAGTLASRIGSLEPADPRLRRGLHIAIAVALLLGTGLAVAAALGNTPHIDWHFSPASLGLGALGFVALTLCNAALWRRLVHALGYDLPPLRGASIWLTSGLGRFVPTGLLLPVVRAAMAEREGVPKRTTLASVVYEFAFLLVGALVVGSYFMIQLPDLEGHWQRFLILALPFAALIVLQPRIFHRVADTVLHRLGREPLPLSLSSGRILEFASLYALTFLIAGLAVYALAYSVYPVGSGDLPTVVGAFATATALSILAFVMPAGLVAREAALAVALAPVMPTAPAVALAVLTRVVQILVEVVLVAIAQLLIRSRLDGESQLDGA